jgi:hypothetical protein
MPTGLAASRYYVPLEMGARVNLDGDAMPAFRGDYALPEPFTDANGNGRWDAGEAYTDANGDDAWSPGNPFPYALADQHNHAMRATDESAKFAARVAAQLETDDTPTYRMLLDRMIANPAQYHNAILVNLHGELLPMPAVRNYSDAAKDPAAHPGWRVVAHPETLLVRRSPSGPYPVGDAKWRVYAYKTEFTTPDSATTLREPFNDLNKNGVWDAGEAFSDWNGNGRWDDACPITIEIPGIDATAAINAASSPSMIVQRLRGGIDADGDGVVDAYSAFANAPRFPESFTDANGNGVRDQAEAYFDTNLNGSAQPGEPFVDLDGDGNRDATTEAFVDANGNGRFDGTTGPADEFADANGNGRWDAAEPFLDVNGDGVRNGPTVPILPWRPYGSGDKTAAGQLAYAVAYGEPYTDVDGNGAYTPAETLTIDNNGNGRFDGGYKRGEMFFAARYDAAKNVTIVELYGTPLACAETTDGRGLDAGQRLYDLDYIPCPTPATASASSPAFGRDLADATVDVPKNTARWTITIPFARLKSGFASPASANNGDATDRVLEVRARIGSDLATGSMWPTRNSPTNLSKAYSYFYADPTKIPFSERYQFQGDPRHCPYADLDAFGTTFPNGYNWYFDNMNGAVNATSKWRAFDAARLQDGWMGRQQIDTSRYFQWMRTAITSTEAVYTTLTGFSYYYLSVGGDVGYDSANGFSSSIPMNGTPFGSAAATVYEDTIGDLGTSGVSGSQKHVRSNDGANASIRSGGCWWSKPWLGELWQDAAYAGQWALWGNLHAEAGTSPLTYRLVNRTLVPSAQCPAGTTLVASKGRTGAEGCTSYFTIGTSSSTFHHQYRDGETGSVVGDGLQLETNYNFPIPTTAPISRPFSLTTNASGGLPTEFTYTTEFPRFSATKIVDFYNHASGTTGSALVRHVDPTGTKAGHVVVNGLDRTVGSGSAFIARYSLITLLHSYLASGIGTPGRIKQLPRLQIVAPTNVSELSNPASVTLQWSTEWKRWDGLKYTNTYATTFTEAESELVYVLLLSRDNGDTWTNMKTGEAATPGVLPTAGGVPDPARTWADAATGNESWTLATPATTFPEGTYLFRIDGFRKTEPLHYAWHEEKVYVNR